jgi:hypothetical protein
MLPIGVADVLSLAERGHDLYTYLRERRLRELTAVGPRGIDTLYESLRTTYYDLPVLTGPDGPFPVGVLPLTADAAARPEALLGELVPHPATVPVREPRLIEAIQRRGSLLWNGTTFSLDRLTLDPAGAAASLTAYLGTYFDMVCSAGYLELEILAALRRRPGHGVALEALPARAAALAGGSPAEVLLSGGGVDATIAVSTLVVYRRGGEWWMLCEVRSGAVAEYGELYHVAPSFIFQPVVSTTPRNLAVEWSIEHNVFREYLEELFDVPEVAHARRAVAADYFSGHPNLVYLRSLLADGRARLSGVAAAFNLLTHRPEICTLLLIEDEEWFDSQKDVYAARARGLEFLCFNEEFRPTEHQVTERHLESVSTLPLDDPAWAGIARPWTMVPSGAPALILGCRSACAALGLAEPDWLRAMTIDPAHADPFSL